MAFGFSADLVARLSSTDMPTYSYVMQYRSTNASELLPEWLGMCLNVSQCKGESTAQPKLCLRSRRFGIYRISNGCLDKPLLTSPHELYHTGI